MAGKGGAWQVPSQIRGALPIVTMPGDQTKNHVVLHVESPTNPYQLYRDPVLAERTHWWFWLGGAALTIPYHIINLA